MQTQGRSLQFGSRWWRSWQRNWTRWAPRWCSRWSRTRSHPRCRSHCCRWIRSQCNSLQPWFFMVFHGFFAIPNPKHCSVYFWVLICIVEDHRHLHCQRNRRRVSLICQIHPLFDRLRRGILQRQFPSDPNIGKLQHSTTANWFDTFTITVTLLMHSILGSRHAVHMLFICCSFAVHAVLVNQ